MNITILLWRGGRGWGRREGVGEEGRGGRGGGGGRGGRFVFELQARMDSLQSQDGE